MTEFGAGHTAGADFRLTPNRGVGVAVMRAGVQGRIATAAFAIALLAGPARPMVIALDLEAIAAALVQRMDLEQGERVLLIGAPGRFETLVPLLRSAITEAGGIDLGGVNVIGEEPAAWTSEFTRRLRNRNAAEMIERLTEVDLAVMLPGATPAHAPYAAMQEVLRRGHGRTIHFHWSGAYDLNGRSLGDSPEIDSLYEHVLLETDYVELAASQRRFEAALRGQVVRVTTPLGTDLRFQIGDRPVTRQDGDASARRAARAHVLIDREIELPAGAIRVAPIETTVEGIIAFPDSSWSGDRVEGLLMRIERGRVVSVDAKVGLDAVLDELRVAGVAGRSFREFALGLNPLLAIPQRDAPWIPYYGYGAGVVRLSLGDNSELGGAVTGGYVRWNFFPDATVRVGETIWVRQGKLIAH